MEQPERQIQGRSNHNVPVSLVSALYSCGSLLDNLVAVCQVTYETDNTDAVTLKVFDWLGLLTVPVSELVINTVFRSLGTHPLAKG